MPRDVDQDLQAALRQTPSLRTLGLRLLRLTGMRVGELVDLDLNALDQREPNHCTLRIPLGKTRTEHVIPVSAETAQIRSDHPGPTRHPTNLGTHPARRGPVSDGGPPRQTPLHLHLRLDSQ